MMASCTVDEEIRTDTAELEATLLRVPNGFDEIVWPEDNAFTVDRWRLGQRLFFDPMMSIDSTVSCASCHNPSDAFADIVAISPGVEDRLGERNSPSLANVAFLPHLLREGGVPTLEQQVLVPINEHAELANNILVIAERMNRDSAYVVASKISYERLPDPYVIGRALATYQRTLISGQSAYDRYTYQDDADAMTDIELR